jgi:acyl dehydratase
VATPLQRFTSKTHVVDAAQIKAFARQFDPQPFHLDDDAAEDSLFSGLVASGWHTAAITMRLLVEGGLPLAGGVVGAGGELSWPRPTRPGDVLQVESEVLEIMLSFPKIISGHIGDAIQPGLEWRQWRQIVGLLDVRARLSVMPSA